MTNRVSTASATSSFRREASTRVSRAMLQTAISVGTLFGFLVQELQEAVLQRLLLGLHRVDAATQPDDGRHQVRHPVLLDVSEGDPLAILRRVAEPLQLAELSVEPAQPHPDDGRAAQQLGYGAHRDHTSVVD